MKNLLFLLAMVLIVSSCGGDGDSQQDQFDLYINFWNPNGNNPQISFVESESSPEIRIDFSQGFEGITVPPNTTNVIIDNVRIIDRENVNYEIENITAYEFRDDINDWKEDVEFTMKYEPVEDLDVMLVLDASASLGEDFVKIKDFAGDFVNKIFEESDAANVGVIDFSDVINSTPLTSNQATLTDYINNISQGQFTTLYEAMNNGIDMLQNNNAEGKAIVTFTDGTDNNSDPQFTPSFLSQKLTDDPNPIKINSFTIGFDGNGGVDKIVLEDLAANGGVAEFPNTISEVEGVFQSFSKSISNVYNLTYIRNQQVIPASDPARLRFTISAKTK